MELQEFWELIGMCPEGRAAAEEAAKAADDAAVRPACEKLFDAATGEEDFAQLRTLLGEDADGLKQLYCLARCAVRAYDFYCERGIPRTVFAATMRFLSRFVADNMQRYGRPRLLNGWWFWRQLSLQEFRLGALEYEMTKTEDGTPCLSLHIPADARLVQPVLRDSLTQAKQFFAKYYPAFAETDLYCSSWLLSPALPALLPPDSHILYFQSNFEILSHDEHSDAVLDWVFPDRSVPPAQLPENTSLQKKVKALLLAGESIGWTFGKLKKNAFLQ